MGLMRNEFGGKIMTEFVALKAKMYAYRKIDKKSGEEEEEALQTYKKVCGC